MRAEWLNIRSCRRSNRVIEKGIKMIQISRTRVYVDAPSEVPADVRDRIAKRCNEMLNMPTYVLEGMHKDYQYTPIESGMEHLFECICEAMEDALEDTPWEHDLEIAVRFYVNGFEYSVGNREYL